MISWRLGRGNGLGSLVGLLAGRLAVLVLDATHARKRQRPGVGSTCELAVARHADLGVWKGVWGLEPIRGRGLERGAGGVGDRLGRTRFLVFLGASAMPVRPVPYSGFGGRHRSRFNPARLRPSDRPARTRPGRPGARRGRLLKRSVHRQGPSPDSPLVDCPGRIRHFLRSAPARPIRSAQLGGHLREGGVKGSDPLPVLTPYPFSDPLPVL